MVNRKAISISQTHGILGNDRNVPIGSLKTVRTNKALRKTFRKILTRGIVEILTDSIA